MVANCATCCSTKGAVMTDQMACHAADYCSFDAALGVCRYRQDEKCNSYRSASHSPVHLMLLESAEVAIQPAFG
jgi:hypothetical protein